MWGNPANGRLGNNNDAEISSPVQIGALTNWATVSAGGSFTTAVKTDGTLWTWGAQAFGQLGQNNALDVSSPVQIGALTTWAQSSAGIFMCAAIKTDSTLWTWGRNNYGQLGQNNTTTRSSPVQVGSLTDWSQVSTQIGGEGRMSAVKTGGTLWGWGFSSSGETGNNSTIRPSSPVQVGALTTWSQVSAGYNHTAAITKG
jgi:alpha-tubulin suppressor-like RCC1 family protein